MVVAATKVTSALDASVGSVPVGDVFGFPATAPYTVRVDSEWMRVTAGAGTATWTVTRGYAGTTAATHLIDVAIYHVPDTYADLSRIKRRLRGASDSETTVDDDLLSDFIGVAQSQLVSFLGMALGPTTETVILLDGGRAVDSGRRLHVPFGIQTLTSVEVLSGTTWETVTAADIISRPRAYEPRIDVNQPTTLLQLKSTVTGSWSSFPAGVENVRVTGDPLGWAEPPAKVGEIADTLVVRMYQARQTGQRDYVGSDEEGNPIISRFMSGEDRRVLMAFRHEISDFGYI